MEMVNRSNHKADCSQKEKPLRIGIAYFCPECENRLGFLPDKKANKIITDSLKAEFDV